MLATLALKLRDIPKGQEKVPVIPEVVVENERTNKFENTVDIYLWWYKKLLNNGFIDIDERYPIINLNYTYEFGIDTERVKEYTFSDSAIIL